MNKTKKIYDENAYQIEFDANVLLCEKIELDQGTFYQVVLDQTLFFPEEGGQTPDKGTIHHIKVCDVQIKDGIITHTLEEPITIGTVVHGRIDWNHRFNNMQQHSGEHIFSGLVHKRYGYENVGFHLSDQIVTMDFNGPLSMKDVEMIETAANEVIINNLPIQATFPTKDELSKLNYRSKKEIDGQVRIVTIQDVDVCACCAPHVKSTGEIGMLKIITMQNYKGGVRISFLCGFRALEEFRKRSSILSELSVSLSTNQESIIEAIDKLKNVNQSLKNEVILAKQDYMRVRLDKIEKDTENVYLFERDIDAQVMRAAVNQLVMEHCGMCGIFVGKDEDGYRFIIGSKDKDVSIIAKLLKESFGAKGGGSASMVQGSVQTTRKELETLFKNCE